MLTLLYWYWHWYWYWNRYRQRQWQLQRLDKHQGTVKEWKLTLISTPNPCNLLSKLKWLLFTTARSCRQTPEIWRRLPRRKRRRLGWCQSVSWNITKDLVLQELKDTLTQERNLTIPVPMTGTTLTVSKKDIITTASLSAQLLVMILTLSMTVKAVKISGRRVIFDEWFSSWMCLLFAHTMTTLVDPLVCVICSSEYRNALQDLFSRAVRSEEMKTPGTRRQLHCWINSKLTWPNLNDDILKYHFKWYIHDLKVVPTLSYLQF